LDGAFSLDLEECARFCEYDAAATTLEQGRTEFRFQGANLHAQRRLNDVQSRRGSTEVSLAGDCQKITEVAQLHGVIHPFIGNDQSIKSIYLNLARFASTIPNTEHG
jgi:hypothetical protein